MSGLTAAALAGLRGGRRPTFAAKAVRRRGQGGVAGVGPQPGPGVAQLLLELTNLFLLLPRLGEEFVDLGLELAVGGLQLSDALLGVLPFQLNDASAQGTQVLPDIVRHLVQRLLIDHAHRHHAAIVSTSPESGYGLARKRILVLVALTGWGQEEDRRRSKEAGF